MKHVIKKKYLSISFTLTSPLGIGSGESNTTDKDIIRNTAGNPYIPATSIAGVIRERLENNENSKDLVKRYLGDVDIKTGETLESGIIFYDGNITPGDYHVSIRDSVALDKYKTAETGAKFDMEVLEPGVKFTTCVEQTFYDGDDDYIEKIAEAFSSGIAFGGKTTRGYGEIRVDEMRQVVFDLRSVDELKQWLDFNPEKYDNWESVDVLEGMSKSSSITVHLKQRGGLSIRRYTTEPSENDVAQPDMEQLTAHGENGVEPVIPGTTWAGAIRHRMNEFGIDGEIESNLFGMVSGNEKKKSAIIFGESRLTGAKGKVISRNTIDRFTGGTKDAALFTEKTFYGGETDLVVSWSDAMDDNVIDALAATLTDLHYGFLAIGGETSIGRGLFEITKINGNSVGSDDVYQMIRGVLREVNR